MTREEKLMQQIGQGNAEAAEELVRLLYPEILRYCLWHVPSASLAEDAAQETFLKAIRYYDRYVHKGRCKAFLYRIAANTCVDMYRKKDGVSLEDIPKELPIEESGFDRIHADVDFRQRIRALPPEQQEVLQLRFCQELTLRQIAQVTETPLRTVQSRLRIALKRLKNQLEKEEYHKNRDVKTQLRQYYQQADMTAPEAAVSAAALLARQETRKRKNRQRITFMQFLRMQVRFVGWKVWTIQGAALIMICWMMVRLYGEGYWTNPQSVASVLGSLSVLVFMTIPPFLYRSNRYGMQEVEAATRFSSSRLLLARFIIVGAGDAALVSCILPFIVVVAVPAEIGKWIYTLFPASGVAIQASFLYAFSDFVFWNIGNTAIWTPYVMVIACCIEIPLFLGLAVRSYCTHKV